MPKRFALLSAVFILLLPWTAKGEMTPMEKALRALAKKQKLEMAAAGANTLTAQVVQSRADSPTTAAAVQAAAPTATATASAQPGSVTTTASAQPGSVTTTASAQPDSVTAAAANTAAGRAAATENPVDPLAFTGTASAEAVLLSWSNTATTWSGFAGYQVYGNQAGKPLLPRLEQPLATTSYQDVSLTPNTNYQYSVAVVDAHGRTLLASQPITLRLAPSQPPEAPTRLEASTEDERVRLSWQPSQRTSHDVVGYVVYRSRPGDPKAAAVNDKLVEKTTFYDQTGTVGEDYEYTVAAVDTWGVTGAASTTVTGWARPRSRNGLTLMSTAYRGLGLQDGGLNGDIQFTYFIGTLYGEQDKSLSSQPLYLDPISLWLLTADAKYTWLTEKEFPVAAAVGGKVSLQLFAGQQSTTGGSFTFSGKSTFGTLWGGYLALSKSFGDWGVHTGYLYGTEGDAVYFLSKYMESSGARGLVYCGVDFPLVRTMNASVEIVYPLNDQSDSGQHPILINTHVDRLLNFDVSYLHWDQGWAFLGYFNLRFTVFPGSAR